MIALWTIALKKIFEQLQLYFWNIFWTIAVWTIVYASFFSLWVSNNLEVKLIFRLQKQYQGKKNSLDLWNLFKISKKWMFWLTLSYVYFWTKKTAFLFRLLSFWNYFNYPTRGKLQRNNKNLNAIWFWWGG